MSNRTDRVGGPPGAYRPTAPTVAQIMKLGGGRALLGLGNLFEQDRSNLSRAGWLGSLARQAVDIRVRYASLLLLDRVLSANPAARLLPSVAQLSRALAAVPGKREALLAALLPKTDMHVHIDGSVRLATVLDLAKKQQVDLAGVLAKAKTDPFKGPVLKGVPPLSKEPTVDELSALCQIREVQPDFLKMLFVGFDFAIAVMQTRQGLARAAFELMEDSYKDGTMHINAIIAPCLHTGGGLSYDDVIEATIKGLQEGEKRFGIGWELSLAIYRGVYTKIHPEHPQNTALCAARWARRFPGQIGVDVVGAEFEMPLSDLCSVLSPLKKTGVIMHAHAAEMPGQAFNLLTALDLGIKRVGHGIHFAELSATDQKRLSDAGVIFEVSPVSNLKCHCIAADDRANTLKNHPVAKMLNQATICTDDRTVMATNGVDQLLVLERELGWRLFGDQCVALTPVKLFNNGTRAIADRLKAERIRAEGQQILIGINQLLQVLRERA